MLLQDMQMIEVHQKIQEKFHKKLLKKSIHQNVYNFAWQQEMTYFNICLGICCYWKKQR